MIKVGINKAFGHFFASKRVLFMYDIVGENIFLYLYAWFCAFRTSLIHRTIITKLTYTLK